MTRGSRRYTLSSALPNAARRWGPAMISTPEPSHPSRPSLGESLFIVKSGAVRITRKTADGEKELATAGPGDHLGELALLGKGVRLVSAVAATTCEVVEITQRDFVRLQPQKPQACLKLALAIAQDLAQRVADSRDILRELATPAAPKRPGA